MIECLVFKDESDFLPECPENFELRPGTWHCYYVEANLKNQTEAVANCLAQGGFLTSIRDQEEADFIWGKYIRISPKIKMMIFGDNHHGIPPLYFFIAGHLSSVSNCDSYYTGATDEAEEGTYINQDGSVLTYTNWRANEPSNVDGIEHYAVVSLGELWDVPAYHERCSVCKKGKHIAKLYLMKY